MKHTFLYEQAKLWHMPTSLGRLELLRATYVEQDFSPHAHEGFAIGVIEEGALAFRYMGANVVAPAGSINLANPDEPHTGHAAADEGWAYRMFYLEADLLRRAASEVAGRPVGIPFFRTGVIHDPRLAAMIRSLHVTMEQPGTPALERESRLLWTLAQMVIRHADSRHEPHRVGHEHPSVRRAREYIKAHYADNITTEELSRVSALSPFHLIRVFRDEVGVPPHIYLTQVRVARARELLRVGRAIAQVAFDTGFADQSHLTRRFKRIVGVTPGQYRKSVQDAPF